MKQDRSKRLGMDEFMMFFAFSKARQYSVIEGAKDPGVNLIWIGCSLLIVGLGLALYWPTWEIRFILDESPGKTVVLAGGSEG